MLNVNIYDFDGLTQLKNNHEYKDYIIDINNKNNIWYQFRKQEQINTDTEYYKEKLGITDPGELNQLLSEIRKALKGRQL